MKISMAITRASLATVALSTLFTSACGDQPSATAPARAAFGASAAGKPTTYPTVSLVVTVTNADPLGSAYGITNDGQGDYVDGSQYVQALLDQYGTFVFNTDNSNRTAVRWVTYDFTHPVDPVNTYRPSPSNGQNYHFSTGPSAFSPFIAIQNLGVNGNPSTECIYMGNGIANSTTGWRVSFHKGYEDVSSSPTAYAVVTRTSVSPAAWTITPTGSCSPTLNANVAALRTSDGLGLFGYYYIPFSFVLKAK